MTNNQLTDERLNWLHMVATGLAATDESVSIPASELLWLTTEPQEHRKADGNIFPGVMRCPVCDFSRTHVNVSPSGVSAGESVPEPCPNGCGPLWHDTYKRQYKDLYDHAQELRSQLETATIKLQECREVQKPVMFIDSNFSPADVDKMAAILRECRGSTPVLIPAKSPALQDVAAERQRQITDEGWAPEHDDEHVNGQLAAAAACYALFAHMQFVTTPAPWPWSLNWWKQSGQRRDLVKAGALILAEIERIDRQERGCENVPGAHQ